jgi:DUF1707 SHOCT-like domain
MTRADDAQRERALATLRHHYVRGRLDAEELALRTERALQARTVLDLRRCLRDLPPWSETVERARAGLRTAGYVALLAGLWFFVSLFFLVVFVALAVGGSGTAALLAVPLLWLAATATIWLAGRRRLRTR